jgi:hypothetical protein
MAEEQNGARQSSEERARRCREDIARAILKQKDPERNRPPCKRSFVLSSVEKQEILILAPLRSVKIVCDPPAEGTRCGPLQ